MGDLISNLLKKLKIDVVLKLVGVTLLGNALALVAKLLRVVADVLDYKALLEKKKDVPVTVDPASLEATIAEAIKTASESLSKTVVAKAQDLADEQKKGEE